MIIDCHGHYTTEPKDLHRFRKEQTEAVKTKSAMPPGAGLRMSDDEIRESLEQNQIRLQKERGNSEDHVEANVGQRVSALGASTALASRTASEATSTATPRADGPWNPGPKIPTVSLSRRMAMMPAASSRTTAISASIPDA